ncbi:MAG: phosphate/phosphite/phosphonate ABC transporter substrate-binding protein [Algoriphagus sp.]|uniref:phosphate/phosphite/phosphonate ABC transporter substrate-binding protein n=1 Tax=Algoriphagus sp. TaxID=1872435 RepID=UPI00272FAD61|nr:phosphate/phosphite/phosphonate ABC transporter substrate-binding protein [Algoriphagus sp.]MDP2040516.1 phosphate/phosphite/phosphonate ABC transporter substrate-binding protein [Algoriphagus sp.]MDP3472416.1 phosphate/phosphite/phosphonate ABC transporter substrate-binding protein [Algoriphagus sp.]
MRSHSHGHFKELYFELREGVEFVNLISEKYPSAMLKIGLFLFLLFYSNTKGLKSEPDQKIILATYTYDTKDRVENLLPFAKLLEGKLDGKYEIITKSFPTVDELILAMVKEEVDLVFISTAGFLAYSNQSDGFDIAGALMVDQESESTYKSVIAASKKSGIVNWEDVREKSNQLKISMVSENSTSGYLFPNLHLQQHGLTPLEENFGCVEFTGNHKKSLESLVTGDCDLAAFGENDLLGLLDKNDLIHILWVSPSIPLGPVLTRKGLDKSISLEAKQTLLDLHNSNPDVLESIKAGWIEAQNASYFEKATKDYYLDFLK